MPRRCQLTGAKAKSGNNVSHSNRKTKRRFEPNLQSVSLHSDVLGRNVRLRISARTLRTVDKKGGLDAYLRSAREATLPPEAARLQRQIRRKLGGKAAQGATS